MVTVGEGTDVVLILAYDNYLIGMFCIAAALTLPCRTLGLLATLELAA